MLVGALSTITECNMAPLGQLRNVSSEAVSGANSATANALYMRGCVRECMHASAGTCA